MKWNYKHYPGFILVNLFVLSSCNSASSDPEVQAFVKDTIDNMIFVQGGTFMMGDGGGVYTDKRGRKHTKSAWTGYKDNKPAHKVTLDSYYLQKFEVTWKEYDLFSKFTSRKLRKTQNVSNGRRLAQSPADVGKWENAKNYCQWIGKISGLKFDLPTEAQWEYAARSRGKNVIYATDTGMIEVGKNVFKRHPEVMSKVRPVPVGYHSPNPLGFYDMSGNIEEFVEDWFDSEYYEKSPEMNPKGPSSGDKKVRKGGSVLGSQQNNTLYNRHEYDVDYEGAYVGVRCALHLSTKFTSLELKNKLQMYIRYILILVRHFRSNFW